MADGAAGAAARLAGVVPARVIAKDGLEFTVRLYHPDDRPALERFYDDFEPKRAAQGLPPLGHDRIVRWLDAVLAAGVHLLADAGGELIGHGLLVPTRRDGVWEWAIFLAQPHRGRGIGTEVNRLAIGAARALGLRKLWLSVEPYNRAAVRSYEKVGFRFLSNTVFSSEAEMEADL